MSTAYMGDGTKARNGSADEYESAAEWCAARGLTGATGEPLPEFISTDTWDEIHGDLEAFQRRVSDYAYGIAMSKINLPEY